MSFTDAPRFSYGLNYSLGGSNFSHSIRACWIFLSCRSIHIDLSYILEFQIKSNCVFVEHLAISSSSAQEEMEATHIILTPFNLFDWKVEMVILLRAKGIYRVTMGTEV